MKNNTKLPNVYLGVILALMYVPILLVILAVNVVNEIIKVIRRLIVEDAATQAEKNARQRAALSLLMAPLSYFRGHMTGNIHGRLNRSLEGTVKLIKLLFMDFAPAVSTGLAAIVTIFWQLPFTVACLVILVIPVGTFIVFRQISTQKGIRVELMETKADMDGTMVELLGGIETIRALDSAQTESARIESQSEQVSVGIEHRTAGIASCNVVVRQEGHRHLAVRHGVRAEIPGLVEFLQLFRHDKLPVVRILFLHHPVKGSVVPVDDGVLRRISFHRPVCKPHGEVGVRI